MHASPPRSFGIAAAGLMLACWLGWVIGSFFLIGQRQLGDPAAANMLLQQLQAPLVGLKGQPLAVRLIKPHCSCKREHAADTRWQQIQRVMQQRGGRAIELPSPVTNPSGYALLLLDAGGQLHYAGPLQLPASLCGRRDADLDAWLPQILTTSHPPLLFASHCSC